MPRLSCRNIIAALLPGLARITGLDARSSERPGSSRKTIWRLLVLTALFSMAMAGDDIPGQADPAVDARLRVSFLEQARPAISNLLVETENLVGRKMVFVAAGEGEPVVARCIYDGERHEPRIFLRQGWLDVDVAHEVMHMRLDLVEGFGMLAWRRDVARTDAVLAAFGRVLTYVKDEVLHARLVKMGLKMDGEVIRPTLYAETCWIYCLFCGRCHACWR